MPMRVFICAGEPSGDIHGANLIRALKRAQPGVECVGFGGARMAEAGCRLLYPLCDLAVMWFARVLAKAPTFLSLVSQADRYFRHQRPDAVVLIDYPGFNWWMARRAHFHNIPVYYFVPPQLWGWAGWRVEKMRRFVDHVLCSLPFEPAWYHERGVASARYVGHPFFDELPRQHLDAEFLARHRADAAPIIGLLPGSRTQEIERNLSTLVRSAAAIHRARPDTRFLVACFRAAHQERVDDYLQRHAPLPIETCIGRTPEIIELSKACIAVSGSVSLELLYRARPTVVLYRIGKLDLRVAGWFKTAPYICLVNLLAQRELYPEFLTDRCEAQPIAGHVLRWLNEPTTHEALCGELTTLRDRVTAPGACERAAAAILEGITAKGTSDLRHRNAA
jgi:lipid-A-disaccharide synthase